MRTESSSSLEPGQEGDTGHAVQAVTQTRASGGGCPTGHVSGQVGKLRPQEQRGHPRRGVRALSDQGCPPPLRGGHRGLASPVGKG